MKMVYFGNYLFMAIFQTFNFSSLNSKQTIQLFILFYEIFQVQPKHQSDFSNWNFKAKQGAVVKILECYVSFSSFLD